MNKEKKFVSLNVQLSLAVILGILLAAVMYVFCTSFGQYLISVRFLSDTAVERNVDKVYESLETYIQEKYVKGTDVEKLSAWLKKNDYTYLYVYDNYSTYFEAGWSEQSNIHSTDITVGDTYAQSGPRIGSDNFDEDVKNRIVEFADQEYYVFIDVYEEQFWHEILTIVTIVCSFITLLASILVYNATVLRRIKHFSTEVQRIADGDFDGEIHIMHNDEIGMLASNVDNMRDAIVEKHESERIAWEANGELITAMSHDIRSPLTSIIGYLDIIEDKKHGDKDEVDKYIDACRSKAFQLKELSDKLFQYFLVFGNREGDAELENLDASLLFQQILGEHSAEIMSYGYKVNMQYELTEGMVMTDISGLRRLFDNVFSNIVKYADQTKPVDIEIYNEDRKVKLKIKNTIPEVAKKVESTRIGLKTCARICEKMNGTFDYEETENCFAVYIEFPLNQD